MLVLVTLTLAGRAPSAPSAGDDGAVREERALMGSRASITIAAASPRRALAAATIAAALDDLAAWERRVSEWQPGSDVARVNAGAGGPPVAVGDDARALLVSARAWAELTDGAFDPTGGALYAVWARARARGTVPSAAEVADARSSIGWRALEIDGDGVRLARAGMRLDLGAIGKGAAAERASARLAALGFPDHLVDCGGDLAISGRRGTTPWQIALRAPDGRIVATVAVTHGTIATSGDAVRAVVVDGVRYGHVVDPATGRPVRGVRGVTAFAPQGADPLATALYVLGPERGQALLDRIDGAWAIWYDANAALVPSRGVRLVGGRVEVER